MPKLENPKHEAFAGFLARGLKQGEAYAQAGYSPNPAAASRLAKSMALKARVEELKKEVHQKIHEVMASPTEEAFESLAVMGLTMDWVARAFKNIYEESLAAGQFAPANTAVSNIQKLIEIENNGKPEEQVEEGDKIQIDKVTDMLKEVGKIVIASQSISEPIDITPEGTQSDSPPPPLLDLPEDI